MQRAVMEEAGIRLPGSSGTVHRPRPALPSFWPPFHLEVSQLGLADFVATSAALMQAAL